MALSSAQLLGVSAGSAAAHRSRADLQGSTDAESLRLENGIWDGQRGAGMFCKTHLLFTL